MNFALRSLYDSSETLELFPRAPGWRHCSPFCSLVYSLGPGEIDVEYDARVGCVFTICILFRSGGLRSLQVVKSAALEHSLV